jgi:hypothetical protein
VPIIGRPLGRPRPSSTRPDSTLTTSRWAVPPLATPIRPGRSDPRRRKNSKSDAAIAAACASAAAPNLCAHRPAARRGRQVSDVRKTRKNSGCQVPACRRPATGRGSPCQRQSEGPCRDDTPSRPGSPGVPLAADRHGRPARMPLESRTGRRNPRRRGGIDRQSAECTGPSTRSDPHSGRPAASDGRRQVPRFRLPSALRRR